MKKSVLIILIVCGVFSSLHAQKIVPGLSLDTLARVGRNVITERDLIERIELMPWEGKEKPKQYDSSKIKALNSLVAERLLAIEGKHLNVGSDEVSEIKIRGMEKLFVRDELFKREVKQKVFVSDNEINNGLSKFAWQLHVVAITVTNKAAGDSLWRMLQKNVPIASIFSKIQPPYITAVETVQVNFGGLDTLFENNVYAIGKKKFSKPFLSQTYGWTIAVILDRGTNPVYEKMNSGDQRIRVDEILRKKKENIAAGRYFAKIMAPQKAKPDSSMFFRLASALRRTIIDDSLRHRNKGYYAIMSDDVDKLLTAFQSELQKPFIELPEKFLTLGEAIEGLRNLRFGFQTLDENAFTHIFNNHLRAVVESELMAREGYRQNLQYSENVQRDLHTWSNYWISRYLMWRVNDSINISYDELLSGLKTILPNIGTLYEVNIQEVLCDSLTTALRVLNEYSQGTLLSDLAKLYSQRVEWKNRGGISHFIPLSKHSDIACRAFLADTGTIVGPIKIKEGYSIFKVLAKKNNGAVNLPTADSISMNIKNNLLTAKRNQSMKRYVANLAQKYTIDIRYDKLPEVKIQPANMFTRRMIGFGGVITATPMLYPNWEWVKEYRDDEKILP
jgi:hypothetical protein